MFKNRLFQLALLLLLVAAAKADIKSIALVTGLDKVVTVTLAAPYNTTVYAGTFAATINGNPTKLYCIDISHSLAYNEQYQDVSQTDSLLTYVLNNYYPAKAYPYTGSLNTVEKEAGAVQLALWYFSDNLNINGCSNVDASVKTRALAIVADAQANAHTFNLNTFQINIPAQSLNIGSPVTFTVQAFDNIGQAMPNVSITLSTTGGSLSTTTVTTGPTGVSQAVTLTPSGNMTSATITASGTVGIPAGTKYFHKANPNGKQKLILATPAVDSRVISRTITWFNQIQLSVNKTANKSVVNNLDTIVYTISVTNTGASKAMNVSVSDQLPAVLTYLSSSPAGFNPGTGIWSIDSILAGQTKTLSITTRVNYSNLNASSFNLGAASDFNLFVIDTLIQPSADTEGKVAVGGYADLRGYSVGDKLPANSGDVLVVGNHLTFISGRVYNGRAVYQNFITSTMGFSADDGIVQGSVLNFPAAKTHLENLSLQLAALNQTDTARFQYMGVELRGNRNGLNVFNVPASYFNNANSTIIDVPAGATVLVNVSGDSVKLFGGFDVRGTTKDKVFFNFYQATKLHFSGIDVRASVLAPKAVLNFPAGIVTGQLMVRCMYGSGQVNLSPFTGSLTRDTVINNIATVLNASQNNMPGFFNALPSKASVGALNGVTGIGAGNSAQPVQFGLQQNYPNPFNPATVINFSVSTGSFVTLAVYDISGRLIATLANGFYEAGQHTATFNAENLPSGVYVYRLNAGALTATKKMLLQK